MTIDHVVDGETELDSALFNPWVDHMNGLQSGALPIALPGIAGALGEWAETPGSVVDQIPGRGYSNVNNYESVAAAMAASAMLYFPPGYHDIDPITISSSARWILERGAILRRADTTGSASLISIAADDIEIVGGSLDGSGVGSSTYVGLVSIGSKRADITIRDVEFRNTGTSGITSNSGSGAAGPVTIDRCVFSDIGKHGVNLNWNYTDSSITRCVFDTIGSNAIWAGNGCARLTVAGNRLRGIGRIGIELWEGCDDSIVSGNIIELGSDADMGISLAGADRMVASGNRITVSASGPGFGIELVGGKWLSALGNSIAGPIGMPVSVDSVENVQIIGNTFNGAEGSSYGIGLQVIDGGSDQTPLTVAKHVQIIGNVFSDFTCRAIQVQTDCEDVVIQGNVFRDNTKVDLYIQQARFLTIVGNTFDCRGITGSGGDWKFMLEAEHDDGGGHIIVANRFLGDKSTSGIPSGVTSIVANNYGVA